jgi:hypothetical protein
MILFIHFPQLNYYVIDAALVLDTLLLNNCKPFADFYTTFHLAERSN